MKKKDKKIIERAVKKAFKEYRETFKLCHEEAPPGRVEFLEKIGYYKEN